MLGNLLRFVLLVKSILFSLTLDEIEELFIALQVDLVPSRGHLGPFCLGCGLMPSPSPLLLDFARAFLTCVSGAFQTTLIFATFPLIFIITSIVVIFVIIRVIQLRVHLLLLKLVETALHGRICRLKFPLNLLLILILTEDLRKLHSLANRFENMDDF